MPMMNLSELALTILYNLRENTWPPRLTMILISQPPKNANASFKFSNAIPKKIFIKWSIEGLLGIAIRHFMIHHDIPPQVIPVVLLFIESVAECAFVAKLQKFEANCSNKFCGLSA